MVCRNDNQVRVINPGVGIEHEAAGVVRIRDLEKKLDRVFSEYIRLKAADENGIVQCVTCGNYHHWREVHCGHFIPRARKATRFNEMNCHPQCVRCNTFRGGEHDIYRLYLIGKYGKEAVEKLETLAWLGGSDDVFSLQIKLEEYKPKVKQLKKEKGL
jgi:hypothetical protein